MIIIIPEYWSGLVERTVRYFKRRCRGAKWSKMIRSTSGASSCNIYKFSEVLGLISMEKIISKRNGFVVDALFYFEPMQRIQCRRDTFSFGVPVTARVRSFAVTVMRYLVFLRYI